MSNSTSALSPHRPQGSQITVNENSSHLTTRELKQLEIFHAHSGEVMSHDELLNSAWVIDYQETTQTLDQDIRPVAQEDRKRPRKTAVDPDSA